MKSIRRLCKMTLKNNIKFNSFIIISCKNNEEKFKALMNTFLNQFKLLMPLHK